MCIIQLFCDIDDFFIEYEQQMASKPLPDTETSKKRPRPSKLHKSEVMTILVAFHQSGQSTFRKYYLEHVCKELRWQVSNAKMYRTSLVTKLVFVRVHGYSRPSLLSSGK